MQFNTFTRTGLNLISGRATLRRFGVVVSVLGLPRVRVGLDGRRNRRFVTLALEFTQGGIHRCDFSVRSPSWERTDAGLWYRADGTPRAFKPSNWDNPVSRYLNNTLFNTQPWDAPLTWRERLLLALGF